MNTQNQKVVLITGGSRGIGWSIVSRFKEAGWFVAAYARSKTAFKSTLADFIFGCDVSQAEDVKKSIQALMEQLRKLGMPEKIDLLINNAGLAGTNPLDPTSSDDLWDQIIGVNLRGTYLMSKYAAPYLPDETGKIINISSVLGLKGVPDQTAYCAAKHGVIGLTRSMALYLAPRKITVNAICPGWVRTEMAAQRMKELSLVESDFKKSVPLGRFIEPYEIADFAYQLSTSMSSSMITGQSLAIDGGATL
jgi:NAD(P)-dependent dehydrogenase (short-subunit alcohol dehydrogenase family)